MVRELWQGGGVGTRYNRILFAGRPLATRERQRSDKSGLTNAGGTVSDHVPSHGPFTTAVEGTPRSAAPQHAPSGGSTTTRGRTCRRTPRRKVAIGLVVIPSGSTSPEAGDGCTAARRPPASARNHGSEAVWLARLTGAAPGVVTLPI